MTLASSESRRPAKERKKAVALCAITHPNGDKAAVRMGRPIFVVLLAAQDAGEDGVYVG
jgi:hypothetical protein